MKKTIIIILIILIVLLVIIGGSLIFLYFASVHGNCMDITDRIRKQKIHTARLQRKMLRYQRMSERLILRS